MIILHGQHTVDAVVRAGKEAYDRLLVTFIAIYGKEKGQEVVDNLIKNRQRMGD